MAKVLILEDSTELQEMFKIILKMKGMDCITVATKADFMRQLILNHPDILLIDVMLRGEDGREICKEIKKHVHFKNIPVILISANPEKLKDYELCLANDAIEKPFDINTLTYKVNTLLSNTSKIA